MKKLSNPHDATFRDSFSDPWLLVIAALVGESEGAEQVNREVLHLQLSSSSGLRPALRTFASALLLVHMASLADCV